MSLDAGLAAALFALGLGQLAAMIGIYYRHAIPRAPWYFRFGVVPFGVASGVTAFILGSMFLVGAESFLAIGVGVWAAVHVAFEVFVWWGLNLYALWHYVRRVRGK